MLRQQQHQLIVLCLSAWSEIGELESDTDSGMPEWESSFPPDVGSDSDSSSGDSSGGDSSSTTVTATAPAAAATATAATATATAAAATQ